MPKTNKTQIRFSGYSKPNYTMVPDELFDEQLPYLSGAELKVLLYIIRRTFGFKKDSDNVSLNQMTSGIVTNTGKVLDRGTGLSKAAVALAAKGLEEKGLIIRNRRRSDKKGDEPTTYTLNIQPVSNNWTPPLPENGHPPVQNMDTQETVEQQTVKQDIYLSNIRKAKSDEFDYVNSTGGAEHAAERRSSTHNERVGASQNHSTTNGRNIEKTGNTNFAPAQKTNQSPALSEPQRKGGLAHIGQTLQSRQPVAQPAVDATVARDAIERFIRDTAAKLHDEAPLKSSTTRAFNLYQRSGVDLGTFYNLMYDAEKEANRRSATIKKLTAQGFKNRMAYFFALLEDKLGLREKPLPHMSQTP